MYPHDAPNSGCLYTKNNTKLNLVARVANIRLLCHKKHHYWCFKTIYTLDLHTCISRAIKQAISKENDTEGTQTENVPSGK